MRPVTCHLSPETHASTVQAFLASRLTLWLSLPVGAALSLAFAPFDLWPLGILCPAFLFAAWQDATPKRAAKLGFLFTSGTFLAGTYWLYHSVHVIGKAPIALTIVIMLGLVAIMGAYTAALGYVQARLARVAGAWRWLLLLPAMWTLVEWFRGWFLSGFPWLALGYTQIDTPLRAFAPLGGVYFVSLLVAMSAGVLVALVFGRARDRWIGGIGAVVIWLLGAALWQHEWTSVTGGTLTAALVQGAVPQEMKWSDEQRDKTLELYPRLTTPHLGADLIVWPEAALPLLAHQLSGYLGDQWGRARAQGSTMLIGIIRYEPDTRAYTNSVLGLDEDPQWYDKRRLVPFAEFFPVPDWVKDWLKGMDLPYSGFRGGRQDQPPLTAGPHKLALTICYEDAYASDQLNVLNEATALVNVTNDAWFGDSTARHQHLQISRMRALEAGRPLLRVANDGISAVIDHRGEILDTLPNFQPGVLRAEVQPREGLTPYARVGNWLVIVLSFAFVVVAIVMARRHAAQ